MTAIRKSHLPSSAAPPVSTSTNKTTKGAFFFVSLPVLLIRPFGDGSAAAAAGSAARTGAADNQQHSSMSSSSLSCSWCFPRRLRGLPWNKRHPRLLNQRRGLLSYPSSPSSPVLVVLVLSLLSLLLSLGRRGGINHYDESSISTSSLSLLLFQPRSDQHLEQQQQQEPSHSKTKATDPNTPRLWSYQEIDAVLHCDSQEIVNDSVARVVQLMGKARRLSYTNQTAYGTLRDPLFGFFIPKTGSNTQEYYQLEALAAIQQVSYIGCEGNMYGCLQTEPHRTTQTCGATAFGNHFNPRVLIQELIKANCTTSRNWHDVDPAHDTTVRDVLAKYGVCTVVFRNPLERIVSGFYEWQYRQTTNLTALEFWKQHGAALFPKPQPQGSFIGMYSFPPDGPTVVATSENHDLDMLEAVLTSCVVGVTEQLTDYVTTLSRILWIQPPAPTKSALKARSRTRHGMTTTTSNATESDSANDMEKWLHQFYEEMEVYVRHDMAVWQLARHVAMAQVKAAQTPPHHHPVIPPHLVPVELRKGIDGNCPGCTRCSPPEYQQFRWTSYVAAHVAPGAVDPQVEPSPGWVWGRSGPKDEPLSAPPPPVTCIGPNIRQVERVVTVVTDTDGNVVEEERNVTNHCCAHAHGA